MASIAASTAPAAGAAAASGVSRRGYLDWLRGVGVLIMIEAHTVDSWTRAADRSGRAYAWALIIGGFGAPIFLFLAGVALALARGSRLRRGASEAAAGRQARRRGWQIFGLGLLFRLQSKVLSAGSWASMLKVDILNVMGISMVGAALLLQLGRRWRVGALLLTTVLLAMLTPPIRAAAWLTPLPDWLEWYVRPQQGRTTFAFFPWTGFLTGGAAVGLWLDSARDPRREQRVLASIALIGTLVAVAGYLASLRPPIYPVTSFWTSSPTFFFLRLGILTAAVPAAWAWRRLWPGPSPLEVFGVASLFVYWVHVEMVYGLISLPLHKALPFPATLAVTAVFALFLYWLVQLKARWLGGEAMRGNSAQIAPDPALRG